jgi:hypothetical protein
MVEAGLDFVNGADLPSSPVASQAECLRVWSRLQAKRAVAEAGLVGAFGACDGPRADGQKSLGAWIRTFTRCTDSAARGQVAASLRIRRHPHVRQALADGTLSESYGRWICGATAVFHPEDQDTVEEILVQAAVSGAVLEDLTTIATAALRKLRPGGIEKDEAQRHADRGLTLSKTLDGVGRINGDLTADATALAESVIEALAVKAGPEDTRTKRQRRHDAFAEAMRRLAGTDLLPERGGSKPQLKVDIGLDTLRRLPGSKQAEDQWIDDKLVELARRRLHGEESIRELITDQPPQEPPPGPARPDREDPPRPSCPPAGSQAQGLLEPSSGSAGSHSQDQVPLASPACPHTQSQAPPARAAYPQTEGPAQLELPGLGQGAVLAGVGPISDGLAAALACDSTMTPTVTGAVDQDALKAMTGQWLHAHGFGCPDCIGHNDQDTTDVAEDAAEDKAPDSRVNSVARDTDDPCSAGNIADACVDSEDGRTGTAGKRPKARTYPQHGPGDSAVRQHGANGQGHSADNGRTSAPSHKEPSHKDTCPTCGRDHVISRDSYLRLQRSMLRWAIEVLSGPGGLASYLRTNLLDGPLATNSIVLDAGKDDKTVPAPLERLVRRRDRHCRFPGCDHPPELSQVHHIVARSQGGPTSLWNLLTLCSFHHLIAVHTWGWTVQLNPDGTVTATGPDGRVLQEHDPPGDPPLQVA